MTRRRSAILAGLVAGLLLLQASPALAYKWKRTVTIGVDPNGVPVKIDAHATGAGGSTGGGGRRGGGAACQYTLASVGNLDSSPYVGQPADVGLFSIQCGSFVDVRFLRLGPNGSPLMPQATVDPVQLALSARDRLPVPTGGLRVNPTRALVGLPTWYWYQGYDGRPLTRTISALGVTVQVEATPTAFRWDFGDGTTMTSADLGRPFPQPSTITHTYQAADPQVTVRCTFDFAVRWRVPGGPWASLAPISRTATATFEVAEAKASSASNREEGRACCDEWPRCWGSPRAWRACRWRCT